MVLKFHQHQMVIFLCICNGILFSFLFKEKPIHFHDIGNLNSLNCTHCFKHTHSQPCVCPCAYVHKCDTCFLAYGSRAFGYWQNK